MRILVVEDDQGLRPVLAEALAGAGHAVDLVARVADARDHLATRPYDLDVVRTHMKLLRRAIGDDGAPRLIEAVHGVGWRLAAR